MSTTSNPVQPPRHLRVFLASPGDVAEERRLALEILDRLPDDPVFRDKITLRTIAWDKPGAGTPLLATVTPQDAIAKGLTPPSDCDIVIVILWSRLGTPLPADWKKPDGSPYHSGTEWEYRNALEAAEQHGKPKLLLYRRTEKVLLDPDDPAFEENANQWRRVKAFFAALRNPDGSIRGGCNEYATPLQFKDALTLHLRALVQALLTEEPVAGAAIAATTAAGSVSHHQTITHIDTGGGAYIGGSVTLGGGDFTGRDRTAQASDRGVVIGGNASGVTILTGDGNKISVSAGQVDPLALLHSYYRSLAEECRRLPLGIGRSPLCPARSDRRSLAGRGLHRPGCGGGDPQRRRSPTPLGLAAGARRGRRAAATPGRPRRADNATRVTLLGDAGSGKTTFVNYLSYRLAQGIITAEPHRCRRRCGRAYWCGWCCVMSSAVCPSTPPRAAPASCGTPSAGYERTARSGRRRPAVGVSATAAATGRRPDPAGRAGRSAGSRPPAAVPVESIQDLAAGLPPQSRLLLTARPYAYADPRWQLPGFQLLALAPFRREQVEQFITHWHQAVRASLGWDSFTADARARHLSQALFQKPYLADLASRPLLLTLMATLDSSWGQLPDDRADLYEESVKLLLSRWQQNREVRGADGQLVQEPGIARALSLGERVIRSALERLAFQMHQRQGGEAEWVEAPADITMATSWRCSHRCCPTTSVPTSCYATWSTGLACCWAGGKASTPFRIAPSRNIWPPATWPTPSRSSPSS